MGLGAWVLFGVCVACVDPALVRGVVGCFVVCYRQRAAGLNGGGGWGVMVPVFGF